MKLGKLKFSDWKNYYCCWEIYASEDDPSYVNYTFAITIYHNKKDRVAWNPPPQDYYDPLTLSNWTVYFYNVSPQMISVAEGIQNAYNSLYGSFVPATEEDIKKHVGNFIERLNKIKIFV